MRDLPFRIQGTGVFFEKANAEPGKRRCVAGILSSEERDQEGETILQDGIDFSYFLEKGVLNDDHDKSTDGIVGYPTAVTRYQAGDRLPDGSSAPTRLTWVEGYLLDRDDRADKIWKKGLALQGTPRALAFSVEGKAKARGGLDNKTVIKSFIWGAAITYKPVNAGSRAHLFFKSLGAVERMTAEEFDRLSKGLKHRALINKAQAAAHVVGRYPGISKETARRVVEMIFRHADDGGSHG